MHSFLSSPTPKSEISKSANKSPPPSCLQRAPKMQLLNLLLLQSLVEKTSQQTERQKDWSLLEALLTHPMQQPKARRCTATNLLHTGRLTVDQYYFCKGSVLVGYWGRPHLPTNKNSRCLASFTYLPAAPFFSHLAGSLFLSLCASIMVLTSSSSSSALM